MGIAIVQGVWPKNVTGVDEATHRSSSPPAAALESANSMQEYADRIRAEKQSQMQSRATTDAHTTTSINPIDQSSLGSVADFQPAEGQVSNAIERHVHAASAVEDDVSAL